MSDNIIISKPIYKVSHILRDKISKADIKYIEFYISEAAYNVHIKNDNSHSLKLLQCSNLVLAYHQIKNYSEYHFPFKYESLLNDDQLKNALLLLCGEYTIQKVSCLKSRDTNMTINDQFNIIYVSDEADRVTLKLLK